MKTLFLIAGASGEIGEAFIKKILNIKRKNQEFRVIGISRKNRLDINDKRLSWWHIDLTDPKKAHQKNNA